MTRLELADQPIPDGIDQTWEQLAQRVDQHTQAVQLWLDTRTPEAETFSGVGVRCGSTGIPIALLNQAMGANFPVNITPGQIKIEVEAIIAFFATRGMPWYWWLSSFCQPSRMAEHLAAAGLLAHARPLPAMVAFLPMTESYQLPLQVRVWQAENAADLQAASAIRHTGFRFPAGVAEDYFEAMADSWLDPDGPAKVYLAAIGDGPPVALGALVTAAEMPGVYVMATLPEFGRRGLGSAILGRMMQDAADAGHRTIALTASTSGYGLYEKFGFKHVFDYKIYQLPEEQKV